MCNERGLVLVITESMSVMTDALNCIYLFTYFSLHCNTSIDKQWTSGNITVS